MVSVKRDVWSPQETVDAELPTKSKSFQRSHAKITEHRNEMLARYRKRHGQSSHAIHFGCATHKLVEIDGKWVKINLRTGQED